MFACKGYPATFDESRTYTVSCANAVFSPCTHGYTVFIKSIRNTADGFCCIDIQLVIVADITIHCVRCTAVDIVVTLVGTHILPALYKSSVYSVVQITINLNYTGAESSNIATICTYQLSVNNGIVVAVSFNNSTEINYGLTSLAVGSAGITCFGAGSILVFKSNKFCIVLVVGRGNCSKLGCNVDGATEEVAVNNTVNNVNINIDNGFVTKICKSIMLSRYIIETVISPNSYGNAYESVIESLAAYTVSFNGHSKNLGNLVALKCSLEAVSNDCALSLPLVCIVQLKLYNKLVYVCEICNVDVNVVDGLCLGSFTGIVVTAKLNYCITSNSKGTGDLHGVAKLVLNLECNGMNTCTESNVSLSGKHCTGNRGLYNNTVNGDLAGGKVKRCVISNGCRECNVVTVDNDTVFKRNGNVGGRVSRSCDSRKYSIVNSGAIVKSDVVNVECNYISGIRLNISTNEGRRTRVAFVCCNGCAEIIVLGNIDGSVNPSGFGNICVSCRVQVCGLTCCSRNEHKVILLAGIRTVSILYIELRLECKTLTKLIITATS